MILLRVSENCLPGIGFEAGPLVSEKTGSNLLCSSNFYRLRNTYVSINLLELLRQLFEVEF